MREKYTFVFIILLFVLGTCSPGMAMQSHDFDRFKTMPDSHEKVDSLFSLAKSNWYQDPPFAVSVGRHALMVCNREGFDTMKVNALNIIGGAYYFEENIDSAAHYYDRALKLAKSLQYAEGIARVTNNLGLIHDFLGNYDLAIEFYYQSLEIEQGKNNASGIAAAYLNIGSIYYYLEEYDKALEFMTNSLRLYQQEKDEDGILRCFSNIGSAYTEIGIYESALSYANKALELSRAMKNPDLEAANLNNIGKVYFVLQDYTKSISFYQEALAIEESFNDDWSQANTLRNIGGVYFEQGKFREAIDYFTRAESIATQLEARNLLKELYFDFYRVFELKGDFAAALDYHKKHLALKDSLFGDERRSEIARIESTYRLKYKDQQLELARQENTVKTLTIKTQRTVIFAVAAAGLLVLALVLVLIYRGRTVRRHQDFLEKANQQAIKQQQLLEHSVSELTESQEKYRALADSIQDALVIVKDRKLLYGNQALCRILGYDSPEDMILLTPGDLLSENDLERVLANHDNRISGKELPPEYTISLKHRSGTLIKVKLRVNVIQYQGGPAIIGTIKDLSKSTQYENQLIRAKEKAEKATLSKSMFLAGMSHEIRNHMNSIIGITDVLNESRLRKEQKEFVQVIKQSGDTLLNILNDILDLSKIEAGQVSLDESVFSLDKLLQEVVGMMELKAKSKKLYLKTEVNPTLPDSLVGDPIRLAQVLTNLVGNALKFTDEGGVTIAVEPGKKTTDGLNLKFSVIDTGIGISEDSQQKLFKPFSQTHAAVERKLGGSGLGLVICKHLVRMMQGTIGVESTLGEGSDFWFTAKLKKQVAATPGRKKPPKNGHENKSEKILLVEDNLLNQHLTTSILGKEGLKADIANNGREGVDLFRQEFYRYILMDIQMPVMDGISASRLIREYEASHYATKSTIIAITAHEKDIDRQEIKEAGIDYYLQKPFKPEDLMRIIRNPGN